MSSLKYEVGLEFAEGSIFVGRQVGYSLGNFQAFINLMDIPRNPSFAAKYRVRR